MNILKHITIFLVILAVAISCKKDDDDLKYLNNVTAPSNVVAHFDITQDNTGVVTIIPNAEGATQFLITFGDVDEEVPTEYGLNDLITHTYSEGVYNVSLTAVGLTGLTSKVENEINVTFKAPENLIVTIEQDAINPRIVSVSATADYATVMDIYFGDVEDEDPVTVLPDETATHTYEEPGDYVIRVVAKSGGTATTEYTETITISAASDPVNLPIDFESFTINYAFENFGNAFSTVIDNPDASGVNTSARVAQTVKSNGAEVWAGSFLTMENPIDFSTNKLFKMKVWSPKIGATVKLKVENLLDGNVGFEIDALTTVSNEWEELSYDFSAIDLTNEYQKVVIFFDFGNPGDDAIYYFDDIILTSASPSGGIVGTWKVAPEAGSLGVGPTQGDISWWSIDDAGVAARGCFYDDTYVFGADGSFSNVLGAETWVEVWQGGADACGAPVAPHDGTVAASFVYDEGAGTVTLNGTGAYLGIPKAVNGAELASPAEAPASITYIIEFSENGTVMTIDIDAGGAWWRYKLVKEGGAASPVEGTWQVAPEAGSLGVGPAQGDISWWSIDDAGVAARGCFYDDTYVFGADGSFSNVLGVETWVEGWQGGADACGAPVAPHDGSAAATYTYDEGAGTVTLDGTGAYLGIPKAVNGAELASPAEAPTSVTYIIELSENNTVMIVDIDAGGAWWRYKLVKN
jgi:hypothetical protein